MMNWKLFFLASFFVANSVSAYTPPASSAASSAAKPVETSPDAAIFQAKSSSSKITKFGLGGVRYVTPVTPIHLLHLNFEFSPGSWGGVGFGFLNEGDAIAFIADYRQIVASTSNSSLFLEGSGGFLQFGDDFFVLGARVGFSYSLSERLAADFAWGLEVATADGGNLAQITQSTDFAGKFGLHWYF
jgi:hypothetical protein